MNKILCVTEWMSLGGGAERLLVTLLPELQKKGYRFGVATLHDATELFPELNAQGIETYKLSVSHRWALPESIIKLRRIIRRGGYDAVWGHLYFGNLNAAAQKILDRDLKCILTLHSCEYGAFPPAGLWRRFRMRLEQIAGARLADRIVGVSAAVAQEYSKALGWKDVRVIHNCIPVDKLPGPLSREERNSVRKQWGVSPDAFLISMPARCVWMKGHKILLSALQKLKTRKNWALSCLAIGQGPLRDLLSAESSKLGLADSLSFRDPMPQEELFKILLASDCVVLPSVREPFGIAAAEAMALGVPTVVSRVDGLIELVGDSEAALLVEPGNPDQLAEALWRLKEEPGLRERLSVAGKDRIKRAFDVSAIVEQWDRLFKESLCEKTKWLKEIFFFLLSALGINALFRRAHRGQVKVLLYHGMEDTEQFREQLRHLKRHYNVLRLDQHGEFSTISETKVNVLITFDDGYYSDYTAAVPTLRAEGLSACFFLISNCVKTGEAPAFAGKYIERGESPERFKTLTTPHALEMARQGMALGSHSVKHADFSELSNEQAIADARESKASLSALLDVPITAFAFPWGKYKDSELQALRSDFRRIFVTKHGFNRPEDAILRRNEVSGTRHMYAAASGSLDFFRRILGLRDVSPYS